MKGSTHILVSKDRERSADGKQDKCWAALTSWQAKIAREVSRHHIEQMRIDIHSLENSKRVSKQKIEYKKWQHSHASKQRQSKNGQQTTNETSRVTLTSWPVETEKRGH